MSQSDQLVRFLFREKDVRGEIVKVAQSLDLMLQNHQYALPVKQLLAELVAATSLLTATLKFEGNIGRQQLQRLQTNHDQAKRAGKTLGRKLDPLQQVRDVHPLARLDFVVIQVKRSVPQNAVNMHELLASLLAGQKLKKHLQILLWLITELFAKFPKRCGQVIFPAVHMTRTGRIPSPRPSILGLRALLHEQFTFFVKDQNVNRAMTQLLRMGFRAGRLADHLVVFIDDVENIFLHGLVGEEI